MHRTNTLRKASRQLQRKKGAVVESVRNDEDLRIQLKILLPETVNKVHAWIVDTSIEYDQSYINGFLKVSLEGLRIILRDEHQLMSDDMLNRELPPRLTLYPGGFSVDRFSEIVETGELWSLLDS